MGEKEGEGVEWSDAEEKKKGRAPFRARPVTGVSWLPEKYLPLRITYGHYGNSLTDDKKLLVTALCDVPGGVKLLVEKAITLESPNLSIVVSSSCARTHARTHNPMLGGCLQPELQALSLAVAIGPSPSVPVSGPKDPSGPRVHPELCSVGRFPV